MRTSVPTIGRVDSLARASEIMTNFAVREIPVTHDGKIVGMLARSDLDPYVGQLEWTPVRFAMSAPPHTVEPGTPIGEVARVLLETNFNGIPVAVGGMLAGMVTRKDLLQLLVHL
jgi:CBS domain-containing protein